LGAALTVSWPLRATPMALWSEPTTRSMSICVDMVRFEWPCSSVTSNTVNLLFARRPYRRCPISRN
jgi:hypothetical protein